MILSLKIQNIQTYSDELIIRLKKSTSINKNIIKQIIKYVKDEDWYNVVYQLLSRFDGVTKDKILNYPAAVRIKLQTQLATCTKSEFIELCQRCVDKYFV